jgi:hypothetical protein
LDTVVDTDLDTVVDTDLDTVVDTDLDTYLDVVSARLEAAVLPRLEAVAKTVVFPRLQSHLRRKKRAREAETSKFEPRSLAEFFANPNSVSIDMGCEWPNCTSHYQQLVSLPYGNGVNVLMLKLCTKCAKKKNIESVFAHELVEF